VCSPTPAAAALPSLGSVATPPPPGSPSESTTDKVPADSADRCNEQTEHHGVEANGGDPVEPDCAHLPTHHRPRAVPPLRHLLEWLSGGATV
jgi:hypothetical protein